MAILILGKTICQICKSVITKQDDFYSLPAFVINEKDPLFFFSDNNFHCSCLIKHPFGNIAVAYNKLFLEKNKPANRICIISGNLIKNYDDHIFINYLTSNVNEYLYNFNFVHIDKKYLAQWKDRNHFINELEKLKDSGQWQDGCNYLESLLFSLENNKNNFH